MPQFSVRVRRVKGEPYLPRGFPLRRRLVLVGQVHEVVGKGGVIVVLQTTWSDFADDEGGYVGLRKTCFGMPAEVANDARGGLKARYRMSKGDWHFF